MNDSNLDHEAPPSRRAKIILAVLLCIVVLATVSSMATSVVLYMKSV
jgi:flagellar basal body-associated protein FliL